MIRNVWCISACAVTGFIGSLYLSTWFFLNAGPNAIHGALVICVCYVVSIFPFIVGAF